MTSAVTRHRTHRAAPGPRRRSLAVVRLDPLALYRWRSLARRLGWAPHAMRQVRLAGFPVFTVGRDAWVLGRSALAWFAAKEAEQAGRLGSNQTATNVSLHESGHECGECCQNGGRRRAAQ